MRKTQRRRISRALVLLCLALATVTLAGAEVSAAAEASMAERAREVVAARTGLPLDRLRVVYSAPASYPLTGIRGRSFKVMDTESGRLHTVTLDRAGRARNAARLLTRERAAEYSRYGRLEPALARRLTVVGPGARLPVIIWLKAQQAPPALPAPMRVAEGDEQGLAIARKAADEALARADAEAAKTAARVRAPFVRRLARLGVRTTGLGSTPAITARLSPALVRMVASWREVARVYRGQRAHSFMNIATQTVGSSSLWSLGINGDGVPVAQVEVGGQVAIENPYLRSVAVDRAADTCSPDHSTAVMGIIRWAAPGARYFATGNCNGDDEGPLGLLTRTSVAVNWGARAINHSWGEAHDEFGFYGPDSDLNANDKFMDAIVYNNARLNVFAAGNGGESPAPPSSTRAGEGYVASPAAGYNVIAVGNFDDKNTVTWTDDEMAPSSSFNDPISTRNDREKPEVAAPGTLIYTTLATPGEDGNWLADWYPGCGLFGFEPCEITGTSFASPIVTGVATQLMERQPILQSWPVIMKALLMATAVGNPDHLSARLSEKDGAGGIWAPYGDEVLRGLRGNWAGTPYTCASPTRLALMNASLVAGKRTRVVIAWNTNPNDVNYNYQPSADIDLQVVGPGGVLAAKSTSFDNAYEIVDFRPAVSGTYSIRAARIRCSSSPGSLGGAWWREP